MPPAPTPPPIVPGFEQLYDYRVRLLDRLAQQPSEYAEVLAAIPELEWHQRLDDRGRTLHQIAAHVHHLDTLAFLPRIRRILTEDNPQLTAYLTHHFADELYDPRESLAELLTQWSRARTEIVASLRPLDGPTWTRKGFHPPSGARTLQWWVERAYNHAREHLENVRAALPPAG
jgi:hypothetical protein